VTRLAPLLLAVFAGCTLIDQRTFAPSPEARAQPAPRPPVVADRRSPLVTIDYTVPSPEYTELLHYAVHAAENRSPDVQYDVVAMILDADGMAAGMERATGVMRAIIREHVPADRVHLGVRVDPQLTASQVRVYVR
jgi:hypothetical protein